MTTTPSPDELRFFLGYVSGLLSSALLTARRDDLDRALAEIAAGQHLLPRMGERRVVNQVLQLTSKPNLFSHADTQRWLIRADRAARRLKKHSRRAGGLAA